MPFNNLSRLAVVKIPVIVGIIPYCTQVNILDGVVITFTGISQAKLLESECNNIKSST
ncbi:MAG: hypothetical protein QNK36_04880 [Colwellia sp.]|nr:hypothetical protein [Colwellia sp.]